MHLLPGGQLGGLDGVVVGWRDAGVVERDVDRAVGLGREVEEVVHLGLIGHVHLDEHALHLRSGLRAGHFVHVANHDGGTLGSQALRGGKTNSRRAAGNHGYLARKALGQVNFCNGHLSSPVLWWG